MIIPRILEQTITSKIKEGNKAIILYGPRQIGKTTLIKKILNNLPLKTLSVNADEQKYIDVLGSKDLLRLKSLVSGYDLLFIDEAQRIADIGINLKILVDNLPSLKIVVTGSSSFEIANKVHEPLTGRAWSYVLYPIALRELSRIYNEFELRAQIEERLVYGSYPELFSFKNNDTKREYLEQLSTSYLYKDILELSSIKNSSKIRDLLKLLAFQIGNEVSQNELSRALGIARETVERYIDLLEKSFVVYRVSGLSRNLRKEVSKMQKIYFYDLGIRNIVVDNMKGLKDRNDTGQLWENFLIMERIKLLRYSQIPASIYFWRTYTGAEIDYVEEREGTLFGYEIKYGNKRAPTPTSFAEAYPDAKFSVINGENFIPFTTLAP